MAAPKKSVLAFSKIIELRSLKNKIVKVHLAQIRYIVAEANYTHVFTDKEEFVSAYPLSFYERRMPPEIFSRVHRSYLVQLDAIEEVKFQKVREPNGRTFKKEITLRIGQDVLVPVARAKQVSFMMEYITFKQSL